MSTVVECIGLLFCLKIMFCLMLLLAGPLQTKWYYFDFLSIVPFDLWRIKLIAYFSTWMLFPQNYFVKFVISWSYCWLQFCSADAIWNTPGTFNHLCDLFLPRLQFRRLMLFKGLITLHCLTLQYPLSRKTRRITFNISQIARNTWH